MYPYKFFSDAIGTTIHYTLCTKKIGVEAPNNQRSERLKNLTLNTQVKVQIDIRTIENKTLKRVASRDIDAELDLRDDKLGDSKKYEINHNKQEKLWKKVILLIIWTVITKYKRYLKMKKQRLIGNKITNQYHTRMQQHRNRRGGMHTEKDDRDQVVLMNMNATNTNAECNDDPDSKEWGFLEKLSPNIEVHEDENGSILFRRNNYGLLITKEDLKNCANMATQMRPIEDFYEIIEVQALYQHRESEAQGTAGQGLCAILALVGTMNPQLNTVEAMNSIEGRNAIADIIEEILIPSIEEYEQPIDFKVNPRSPEHDVHKEHTINHLVRIASTLRDTLDIYVKEEEWMYASGVGTIVQAMPSEVVYWQEIRDGRWLSLELWSNTATNIKRQTIKTLQNILNPGTGHVAYSRSHFFNTGEIGANRYINLLIEIVNAMTLAQEQKQQNNDSNKSPEDKEQITSHELDDGSITTQKKNTQWFMSISKKRVRELNRLIPSQIKNELLKSSTTIQISKRIENVNWSLINGDNYCGYQALHAVAMQSEGKAYTEISQNIQTVKKPYKLTTFLQKQVHKLQGPNMHNALTRVNATIKSLKEFKTINKTSWCPTEMIEHILPSINANSNYWNHSRPPTGSLNWITTYYNEKWLTNEMGLDIVFNGQDHYTILPNVGIQTRDILEGLDNLVSAIISSSSNEKGWTTITGQRITRMTQLPNVIKITEDEDEQYIEVSNKKARKKINTRNHGHAVTKCLLEQDSSSDSSIEIVQLGKRNRRNIREVYYGPQYHPLDDPIPTSQIMEIPFPKTHRNDPTVWRKCLVIANSRIGDGKGVYTLVDIPKDTVIMDYIDEENEVVMKRDIIDGTRDTTYMYANHKTNTYINASNNKYSYCGLVNEAFEEKNFNTVICEQRDTKGNKRVFYKTTRNINAKEEIGTRYSIDGSYWDNAKTYSREFLNKVQACYDKDIPYQYTKQRMDNSLVENNSEELNQQTQKYNMNDNQKWSELDTSQRQESSAYKDVYQESVSKDKEKKCQYKYETPEGKDFTIRHQVREQSDQFDDPGTVLRSQMEVSDEGGSDEGLYSNTIYHNKTNIEINDEGEINYCPTQIDMMEDIPVNKGSPSKELPIKSMDEVTKPRKHKFVGNILKRKRMNEGSTADFETPKQTKSKTKHRRGVRRVPRSERNARRKAYNDHEELSVPELIQLSHQDLVEYVLEQRCRHKKALDENAVAGDKELTSPTSEKKKRAMNAVSRLLSKVPIQPMKVKNTIPDKKHNLRTNIPLNYTEQLGENNIPKINKRKLEHREPSKPKYILNDASTVNQDAFMIAGSNLKNNICGVFAREAIPLTSNRKLFEYISENNHGTTRQNKVDEYLSHNSDNKFIVNIGNVVVDAKYNVSSYCNHVQELLNHTIPFNCKYVKHGNQINIIQISPIAKNEELNIQYSVDGSYWNNRSGGYPYEILKKARKFYNLTEPATVKEKDAMHEIPNYRSKPEKMEDETGFNLMDKSTLFRWTSGCEDCNLRIATLNMNGALFDAKNGEPQFALQLMVQCGINVLGLTDTRTPIDKMDSVIKSMKYPQPKGTAMICFPTKRINKDTTRLTTMGGQMIIIDKQWEQWITHKKSDNSNLSLIVSIGITFQQHSLTIIQIMVPPQSQGPYTMWSRISKYLNDKGIKKTPREYVMDTASKWHINELSKGRKVIIMGDFNRTYTQLNQWQSDNNLNRAHEKILIAQEHPDRPMYTYLRNSTTYSHIDHIYHSTLDPITTASVGAIDHVHIHEKTDHFPIWIALKWPGHMEEKIAHVPSASIRNQPDLDLDDKKAIIQYTKELDEYVSYIGEIGMHITPAEAGRIQAAIYAKSAEIARGSSTLKFQATRPKGFQHKYKDGFSPTFRILQESLHAYINLGRVINRLTKKTHTAVVRMKEMHKIYPRWKKVYDKYCNQIHHTKHEEVALFPLELNNITLQGSKRINIAERIAKIKSRLHGRQRTILRAKLSERCKTMQHNISINKLKKVIQMIIPMERSALDYAAIGLNGTPITSQMADLEANRVMQKWMETPNELHYISQEFEYEQDKWKTLLKGTYKPPDSTIPREVLNPVIEAFRMKSISEQTKNELSMAMHKEFTFSEFNNARKRMAKDKSPGPSGVTNNQMKSWSDYTAKAIFDLSSIMWRHHSVPQFWQDRLMTLLPKVAGENDLSKIRPISLFENIRKLWAGMVSRRIQTIWNKENLLHANQHGFRWQRGTHTAVLHLLNQLELAESLDPVYLTMWDIRRAFDSVPKWLQRLAWARLGLNTQDLEWFLKLDSTGNVYIRTPEFESQKRPRAASDHLKDELSMLETNSTNHFHPERGVGQGDTPSSLIFIAVFDILLCLLDESGTGQPHAYADDLAHIARTQEDQQRHADLVSAFCVITGLEVATAKVEAIALNHHQSKFTTTLIIRDWWWTPYIVVQSDNDFWTRYLGIYLDTNLCIKHYEKAVKQYKFSCHALIHRSAPSSAKKMVHTLCLRPKIRYVAALSPWTLQQYKKIDQIPYQLLCQVYGLRRGFPLALIYTPISMGGCGDIKLSDEANSMKWKILHSCIHLGGLSQQVSNQLIQRALDRRNSSQPSRGYADSLIEWCMEMGLTLCQHDAADDTYPLLRLNQLLQAQAPESDIRIYSDGAYDTDKNTTLIDKLTLTPTQIRHKNGIGKSGVYIEGTQVNGIKNRIAMQLTFGRNTRINTTPFLQELFGIMVGINIAQRSTNNIRAYTDCKSALTKVRDAIMRGSQSAIHLPYGPLISAIEKNELQQYQIEWIESHPERKKKHTIWNENDYGIYKADTIASKNMYDIRKTLPTTTIIHADITDMLDAMIPTNTWIWKTNEGIITLESLRTLSSQCTHTTYLNRRDTLRNKGDMKASSRWSKYNMYLATHLNGTRKKCSTRLRGHQCKQMYDWTTHAVNLSKGVRDNKERLQQAQCKLCSMGKIENQVHTSTTCQHHELQYIRKIYKKEIDSILQTFQYAKLPKKERWIKQIIEYIAKNMWGDTETTADIWNGRWNRHMWEDALTNVEEKVKTDIDIKKCRKWMSILTTKLFETQSALSRHRFKLSKRLKDPMFERSPKISLILKKRIFDQYSKNTELIKTRKRKKYDHLNINSNKIIEKHHKTKNKIWKKCAAHKLQLAEKQHDGMNNKILPPPKFKLPPNILPTAKKRKFNQEAIKTDEIEEVKQIRYDDSKESEETPKEISRTRKRKNSENQLCNLQTKRRKCHGAYYKKPNKRYIIPTKNQFVDIKDYHMQKKRKRSDEKQQNTNMGSGQIRNKISKPNKIVRENQDMMENEINKTYQPIYKINTTGKINYSGKPRRKKWYGFLRHAHRMNYSVGSKRKINCKINIQPKKRRR